MSRPLITGTDFLMVVMPWALTNQPSLQAGLLCAQLSSSGVNASSFYANLLLANRISCSSYKDFCSFHDYSAEWLFSEAIFGKFQVNKADFQDYARSEGMSELNIAELEQLKIQIDLFLDDCLAVVDWKTVKIVGFTTTMLQPLPSLALAKRLKKNFPHLRIVFGGSGCHGEMGQALHRNFTFIDGVVDGDADKTIVSVVKNILDGIDHIDIHGLTWRKSSGLVVSSPPRPYLDMDNYPIPAFDDYFQQFGLWNKSEPLRPVVVPGLRIPFEASRGCWWATRHHCKFCGLNGTTLKQRERSVDLVIKELDTQYRKYGPAQYIATDNIISPRHVPALPRAFKQSIPDGKLFFEVGAALSRRQLQSLANGGVSDVQPGIESLSSEVLKMVDKGTTSILNICFLRRAQEFNVTAHWNMLYGLPNEKPAWYKEMLDWIPLVFHLQPPEAVRFSLQRFSPYFENPEKYGIKVTGPMPAMRYVWNLSDTELCDLSYNLAFEVDGDQNFQDTGSALNMIIQEWLEVDAQLTIELLKTGQSRLLDSRSGTEQISVLEIPASTILRLTESPIKFTSLVQRIRQLDKPTYLRFGGEAGIRKIVSEHIHNGILLYRDDKLLALPVPRGEYWLLPSPNSELSITNI